MVKKKNKKGVLDGLEFDVKWGFKGLQISFLILIVVIIILFIVAMASSNMKQSLSNVFKMPQGYDFLGIFAGIILFIAIPFLIGIKIGMSVKKKR